MSKKNTIYLAIFILVIFLSYVYGDSLITQRHGIALLDALFSGKILSYYQYCIDNTATPAVYSISIYILFSLWNIPCWIYEKVTGLNALDSALWIFYGKGLVAIAYVLSITLAKKIYFKFINKEDSALTLENVISIFALSALFVSYSIYTGNYDVLELVFILAGLDAFLDKKEKRFILFFAIATSMKFFAVWVFVPLLLMTEKRIIRVIYKFALCFSITFIEDAIFNTTKILKNNEYASQFMADSAFTTVAQAGITNYLGLGTVSLCFVLYALLCVYCYVQDIDNSDMFYKKSIYVGFVAWTIFFIMVRFNCYWIVLLVPFLIFLILCNPKNIFFNMLCETILSFALFINMMLRQWWVLGTEGSLCSHAIINGVMIRLFGIKLTSVIPLGELLVGYNNKYHFDVYINSTVIVMFIVILIINYPGDIIQRYIPKGIGAKYSCNMCVNVRNAIHIVIIMLPIMYYIYQIIVYN